MFHSKKGEIMNKTIRFSTLVSSLLVSSALYGADVTIDGYRGGELELQFKAMRVLSDYNNGFAPSNGTGYLIKLKYETPELFTDGLKVGVGMYANGDGGYTEWDERAAPEYNKGAYGMVVAPDGASKALTGELYLDYTNDMLHAKFGRQVLKTPLTVIKTSLMPNFYEAYVVESKNSKEFRVSVGHINKISFGSRAMADWGVIGEKTGTAGVGLFGSGVLFEQAGGTLQQAKFYNIGTAAGKEPTNGRSFIGLHYSGIPKVSIDAWLYHAYDIVDDFYSEISYTQALNKKLKLKLSAQYLAQRDTGDALAGEKDFNLYGLKAFVGNKKLGAYIAYNKSGTKDTDPTNLEGQFFNAWGADPGYTSSIFSRNEYREGVSAYKVGAHYVPYKGVKLMMSYAHYGQSLTSAGNSSNPDFVSQNSAYEVDTVLVYKPSKHWMFKLFNARRLSEYNGVVFERRMNQYRVIASYTF